MALEFSLIYETKNFYKGSAKEAIFELLVLPLEDESQKLNSFEMLIEPDKGYKIQKNYLGFDIITTTILEPFESLLFELKSRVTKEVKNLFDNPYVESNDEHFLLENQIFRLENHLFLQKSMYAFLDDKSVKSLPLLSDGEALFEYLIRLNRYIFDSFEFCGDSTDVHTTALETLEIRRGVCQDFAHIFIGICRHQGLPARYVSGYLHQGHGYVGDAFLHAWVEVNVPHIGWIGLDPTNGILADEHYIKIAHGVDYSDCAPIKGVLKYEGEMSTQYSVYVKLEDEF